MQFNMLQIKNLSLTMCFFKSKDNQDKINRSLFTDVIIGPKSESPQRCERISDK